MKGEKNPLTLVLEDAQAIIETQEAALWEKYGVPLFTAQPGVKVTWPADPEATSPEEMAQLVQTRGEEAVNQWLAEYYTSRAEAESLDPNPPTVGA